MFCPLKFSALSNPNLFSAKSENISNFLQCEKSKCAWWIKSVEDPWGDCAIKDLNTCLDAMNFVLGTGFNKIKNNKEENNDTN